MLLRLVLGAIRGPVPCRQSSGGAPRRIPADRGNGAPSRCTNRPVFRRQLAAGRSLMPGLRKRIRERARKTERLARTRLSLYLSLFLRRVRLAGRPTAPTNEGGAPLSREVPTNNTEFAQSVLRSSIEVAQDQHEVNARPTDTPRLTSEAPVPSRSPRYLRQGRSYICSVCGARYRVLDSARKHYKRSHER